MLRENPQQRPNIYEVLRDVSRLRGTEVPIKDVSLYLLIRGSTLKLADLCWPDSIRGPTKPAFAPP